MIIRNLILFSIIMGLFSSCEKQPTLVIKGVIQEGEGKYLKYIDMAQPGLAPDSIQLDADGKFNFTQISLEPKDLVFYFDDKEYIRIAILPNEVIALSAKISALVNSYAVSGSQESSDVSMIIKRHFRAVNILDTLQQFYLKNQTHPQISEIVDKLTFISDSIYTDEKAFLTSFIENNPGSIAAYIALSQKLGAGRQLFTLSNDLNYFVMVDTAMQSRYKNIALSKMLHAYVLKGKMQAKLEQEKVQTDSLISMAPVVRLLNSVGDTLSLAELKGKYVLVDFWGSWCRPSRINNAALREIYRKYRYRGFEIYQIAIEHDTVNWKNSMVEDKLFWKYQVSDFSYMESKAAKDFGVKSMPSNFLINPEGKIIGHNLYGEKLTTQLDLLLKPARVIAEPIQ
jgi:thiol-disulfide isomerase/thioredoxin